ncbi:MAG: GxxExxY protein [Bacteroidales bacterium]|nr:GxxExxY protein [Bacteroidales bacterium]
MTNLILKNESYQIIGKCFEVHNQLGPGFLEIVYKDALELEFQQAGIPYEREKEYTYLKVSGNKLALLVNFGESKLNYQRIVY